VELQGVGEDSSPPRRSSARSTSFPKSASNAPAAGVLLVEAQTAKEEQSPWVAPLGLIPLEGIGPPTPARLEPE
jgi:hypothetical protein